MVNGKQLKMLELSLAMCPSLGTKQQIYSLLVRHGIFIPPIPNSIEENPVFKEKSLTLSSFVGKGPEVEYDPKKHPRYPEDDPQGRGGQFAPKHQGTTQVAPKTPKMGTPKPPKVQPVKPIRMPSRKPPRVVSRPAKQATKPSPVKPVTTHGGYREFSGRLPRDPALAVEKRRLQIKNYSPDMSDDQINQELRRYALEKGKPDWVEYMDNPEEYLRKKYQRIEDARRSGYNKAYGGGVRVPSIDTSDDTAEVRAMAGASSRAFQEEVAKQKTLLDAWRRYKESEPGSQDRTRARLILAAGGIATFLALAGVMYKRPRFAATALRAGGKKLLASEMEYGTVAAGELTRSGQIPYRKIVGGTEAEVESVPNAVLFQFAKITKEPSTMTTINEMEIGRVRKWVSRGLKKLAKRQLGEAYQEEAEYGIRLGPAYHGFGPESKIFDFRERFLHRPVDTTDYILRSGDVDAYTGKILARGTENKPIPQWINLIDAWEAKTRQKINTLLTTEESLKSIGLERKAGRLRFIGSDIPGDVLPEDFEKYTGKKLFNKMRYLESEKRFSNWLESKGEYAVRADHIEPGMVLPTSEFLPKTIASKYKKEELEDLNALYEKYKGWRRFMLDGLILPLDRILYAGLAIATGVGTPMYYFHRDSLGFAQAVNEEAKRDREEGWAMARERTIPKRVEGGAKPQKSDIELLTEYEGAKEQRIRRETTREALRANAIRSIRDIMNATNEDIYIGAGGARGGKSLALSIMAKDEEVIKRAWKAAGYSATNELDMERLVTDLENPAKAQQLAIEITLNAEREAFRKYGTAATTDLEKAAEATPLSPEEIDKLTRQKARGRPFKKEPVSGQSFYRIAGASLNDFVTKEMNERIDSNLYKPITLNTLRAVIASDIIKQIEDISQACREYIENGVPGHTQFEQVNDLLTELYAAIKDRALGREPQEVEPKVEQKSFDISSSTNYMSSQDDKSAGLFVPQQIGFSFPRLNEECPRCGKEVTEELVAGCQHSDCPYAWTRGIKAHPDLEDKKDKEEDQGGEKPQEAKPG